MRGKHVSGLGEQAAGGLIPAHAGKTAPRIRPRRLRPAHPRACGENLAALIVTLLSRGSSPRMRGKHGGAAWAARIKGLIPAHAGKTPQPYRRRCRCRAHPRACGENGVDAEKTWSHWGSSPRMRGKPYVMQIPLNGIGLIPAHAGKTLSKC